MIGVITGGRQIGGAEIICLDLAEWLKKKGEDVWLYVGSGGRGEIGQRAKETGVPIVFTGKLAEVCSETDTVFLYGTRLIGQQETLAERINKASRIYAFVGGFGEDYVTPIHLRVDSYWTESYAVRRFFVDRGIPDEMFVTCRIPMDVSDGIEPKRLMGDAFTFGVVARLIERKRVGAAIRAFKELGGSVGLVIVGAGPEFMDLNRLAYRDKRIKFVGLVKDKDEIRSLITGFDCFVSASQWEGCSRVTREAMALNVPVIATEGFCYAEDGIWGGGTSELVIDGENGLTQLPNDVVALTANMALMRDVKELRELLRTNALKFIHADNVVSGMKCLGLLCG